MSGNPQSSMKNVTDATKLDEMVSRDALMILFGGKSCGVCNNIKPKLLEMLVSDFPQIKSVYVDCSDSPGICAQYGVFSLPVVQVFINGKLIVREFGVFSLKQLKRKVERSYEMWQS